MKYIINEIILGNNLIFETDDKCFSPRKIDKGTLAMLSAAKPEYGQKILDLGCGYGVVGIACAKVVGEENVVMLDISANAVRLAKANARANGVPDIRIYQSDGFRSLDETGIDMILCNPPYHSDFSVAKHFIEKGFNRLNIGGKMVLVTKRREWYRRKLISVFGAVKIFYIDGYFILESEKARPQYAYKKSGRN